MAPRFLQEDIAAGKWQRGIEIGDYHRNKRVLDYTLTNKWGWNRRDTTLQYVTEFYQIWRWLRFQNALAVPREHIVEQLNAFLLAENLESRIKLSGVSTQSDIVSCEARILRGEGGIKDVYEALRF